MIDDNSLLRPRKSLRRDAREVQLTPQSAGWRFCGLEVAALPAGASLNVDLTGREAVVVPLSGSAKVEVSGGDAFDLTGRDNVFSSVTDVCYLPSGSLFQIRSEEGGEFAFATAQTEKKTLPLYRSAEEIDIQIRGAGQSTRQITQLLGADVEGPDKLMVVEVHTPEGNWSSYPPHKHDEWTEDEVPLEEIYYFRIAGDNGFGLHRTYSVDGAIDETVTVYNGDVFLVPRGYHGPCVAAPGYDMYYLNVMAGPGEERAWKICTDPSHEWLWEVWQGSSSDPRVPMTSTK